MSPSSTDWRTRIRPVLLETPGLFGVIWRERPPQLVVLYELDAGLDPEGLRVLLSSYLPPGTPIQLQANELHPRQLSLMREGELIYSYKPEAFAARMELFQRLDGEIRKTGRKRLRDRLPTGWTAFFLVLPAQIGLFVFFCLARSGAQGDGLQGASIRTGIFMIVVVNLLIFTAKRIFLHFLSLITTGPGSAGVQGYSLELSLARQGRRDEAVKRLLERHAVGGDAQALREARTVAREVPLMAPELRGIIQKLLRWPGLGDLERRDLREELAGLEED